MEKLVTYEEWLEYALKYAAENPDQRMGQALYNSLKRLDPELALTIATTDADPFYEEGVVGPRIRAFHAAVMKGLSH